MIFINNSPDVPKKFSSFVKAFDDNYENISSILYWLLGEGIVNFGEADTLNERNDFRLSFYYNNALNKYLMNFKFVNTDKDLKITFVENDQSKAYLSSLKGNSFYSQTLVFDDNNLVSGSVQGKITLPLRNLVADDSPEYSSEYFSALYVNGYPQKTQNMVIEPDENNNNLNIGFTNIYGGALIPNPVNIKNLFSDLPIKGASGKEWIDEFSTDNANSVNIHLKFSNSNVFKTSRYLIMQVIDLLSQNISYFHVPKNISDENGIFYSIDNNDDEKILVSISKESNIYSQFFGTAVQNLQNSIKFMFLNALENLSPFSVNFSSISKKYQLPYINLTAPDALNELKVLVYDTATNSVSDVSLLNTSLLGSLFSLDYENGVLEILNLLSAQITNTSIVFAYNIKYVPPLQIDYSGDFSSNVTIYGTHGSTYVVDNAYDKQLNKLNLPQTLYVWAYLRGNPRKYFPIFDENGMLSSIHQYTELDINFFITEKNESTEIRTTTDLTYSDTRPINIGFLNLNKPTSDSTDPITAFYTFSLNKELMAPYNRYKNLLNDSKVALMDYKTYRIENDEPEIVPVRTINNVRQARKYYKIAYVPSNTELFELYGYLGKNRTVFNDTGDVLIFNEFFNNTQYYYNAKLKIVDSSVLYNLERSVKQNPSSDLDYTGLSIDVYAFVDPVTASTNISKEYIELVSNDTSESTIFAPRLLEKNFLDLINNKVLVLEVSVPVSNMDVTNLVFNLDMSIYLKFVPRVVNYINTL